MQSNLPECPNHIREVADVLLERLTAIEERDPSIGIVHASFSYRHIPVRNPGEAVTAGVRLVVVPAFRNHSHLSTANRENVMTEWLRGAILTNARPVSEYLIRTILPESLVLDPNARDQSDPLWPEIFMQPWPLVDDGSRFAERLSTAIAVDFRPRVDIPDTIRQFVHHSAAGGNYHGQNADVEDMARAVAASQAGVRNGRLPTPLELFTLLKGNLEWDGPIGALARRLYANPTEAPRDHFRGYAETASIPGIQRLSTWRSRADPAKQAARWLATAEIVATSFGLAPRAECAAPQVWVEAMRARLGPAATPKPAQALQSEDDEFVL